MRQVTVSIEEWVRLVESGVSTPARVTPRGSSMWPLIRDGRDAVEVMPFVYKETEDGKSEDVRAEKENESGSLRVGDIIVFRRFDGAYVVHRIWKIKNGSELPGKTDPNSKMGQNYQVKLTQIQTFGDNCQKPDEPISIEDVCGVVTKIYRDGYKVIDPGSRSAIAAGMINRRIAEMKHYVKERLH